jgi:glycosyltransferase involved in cell wall biosynthesis
MWVEDWRVPAFRDRLRQVVERSSPNVVQFESHIMAQYASVISGGEESAKILVEHEAGAAAARDRWQLSRGWRRLVLGRDKLAWEKYEREILARFDRIVCFTQLDRRELLKLQPGARIEVIPPSSPSVPAPGANGAASGKTVLFLGNFVHPPNVDAAMRLAGSIFPRVRARHPDAVLQLVGDGPLESVRRFADQPGIVIPGRVPEVKPWLEAAAVVVAPLRMGGGIRIKVMDALAFGKAMVASPLAAEGLDIRDGREILLAEEDEAFADAVSSLLSDAVLRERLSVNARAWAVQFAIPGRVASAFGRLYTV